MNEFRKDYVFTQPLRRKQYVTQGRFLSSVLLVLIQRFLSAGLVALPSLKNSVSPTSYP